MRFLHTGDLHLASSFVSLSEEQRQKRTEDQHRLLKRILSLAEEEKAELLLIAGDLFDVPDPGKEWVTFVQQCFCSFSGKIVLVPGNHDYYRAGGMYDRQGWPENTFIFKKEKLNSFVFSDLGTVVWGSAYTKPFQYENPLKGQILDKGEQEIGILLLHGELDGKEGRYSDFTSEDISNGNASYAALAHRHLPENPKRLGKTVCVYCGTPEPRGMDEEEKDIPMSVVLGSIEEGILHLERKIVTDYRTKTLDIWLETGEKEELFRKMAEPDPFLMLKLNLHGNGESRRWLSDMLNSIRKDYFSIVVTDHLDRQESFPGIESESSLKSEALAILEQTGANSQEKQLAARLLLAALEGKTLSEVNEE